jgi:hypothetical protein
MSAITNHINYQSKFLLEIPERLNLMSFFAKILSLWYVKKLDVLRAEIIGLISMIKNNEIKVDTNSHYIFQKIFGTVYLFHKTLEKDSNPSLYNLKITISKLSDSLQELLALHEQRLLSDDDFPIDITKDDYSDWTVEEIIT